MLTRLVLLFVLVPVAELMLLVWLGEHVGLLPTLALVLSTGVLGAALARHQGLATWGRFRAALAAGRPPHRELVEGILVLVAGAFLLTPGLITDSAGFALLVPPLRRRAAAWLTAALGRRFPLAAAATRGAAAGDTAAGGGSGGGGRPRGGGPARGPRGGWQDDVVDVDFRVVDDDEPERDGEATPDGAAAPADDPRTTGRGGRGRAQ